MMLNLDVAPNDDRGFVEFISRLIAGTIAIHRSPNVLIYKIDHWFDHKWLGFSGKTLGALGVWRHPLTIPPFVANRVVCGWHFQRDELGIGYREADSSPDIHHRGWSARNLQRRVEQIVPNTALFWFSGNTIATGRGSLMAYVPVDEESYWPWFVAFARDGEWKVSRRKDIQAYEIRLFEEAAENVMIGNKLKD